MADIIAESFARLSFAWAVILVYIALDIVYGLLFKPGSGLVRSPIFGNEILSKWRGFLLFLAVTLVLGILDPGFIINWLQTTIYSDGNLIGQMGLAQLIALVIAWVYFNLAADLNPLSLPLGD